MKIIRTILGIFCLLLTAFCVACLAVSDDASAALVFIIAAVVFAYLAIRCFLKKKAKKDKKKRRTASSAQATPHPITPTKTAPIKPTHELKVKLAGTAKVKARQGYLQKIAEMLPPFDDCYFGINQTEWEGKPAFQVLACFMKDIDDKVIGMVPADEVDRVLLIYDRIVRTDVEVYGGPEYEGDDKYYGASATFYYR